MKRAQSALALGAWSAALAAALVLLNAAGVGPLGAPPLTGWSALQEWLAAREPAVAAVAMLRPAAMACCWYLVAATSVCVAAAATRLPALVGASRAVALPSVRRVVNAALGAGMVATTWAAPVAASEVPLSEPPVLRWIDDARRPAGTTETGEAVAPPAGLPPEEAPEEAPAEDSPEAPTPVAPGEPRSDAPAPADEPPPSAPTAQPQSGRAEHVGPAEQTGRAEPAADQAPEPGPAHRAGPAAAPVPPSAEPSAEPVPAPVGPTDPAGPHQPEATPVPPPAPEAATWAVEPGDSFWRIARVHLERTTGREPANREVLPYWRTLIDTNRDELADPANPDLLLVGQNLTLPPP